MKRLHQYSKASHCILCHLYRFISSWTSSILGQIGQYALFFSNLERQHFVPCTYSGENAVGTITPLFLIVSSSNLQVTRTGIKSQRSSNSGHIRLGIDFGVTYPWAPQTYCGLSSAFSFDRILFKLAGNQDEHKILDKFDFVPDLSIPSGLHALEYRKFSHRLI